MASADELRDYVRRDRTLLDRAKQDFWIERRQRISVVEALRIGDDLRRQVREIHPDWPRSVDREADLAAHTRLAEILGRAAPAANR